jgi:hypothetical protein
MSVPIDRWDRIAITTMVMVVGLGIGLSLGATF